MGLGPVVSGSASNESISTLLLTGVLSRALQIACTVLCHGSVINSKAIARTCV